MTHTNSGFNQPMYKGKEIVFDKKITHGILFVDEDSLKIVYPKKKDGTPDMRYSTCKTAKSLGII